MGSPAGPDWKARTARYEYTTFSVLFQCLHWTRHIGPRFSLLRRILYLAFGGRYIGNLMWHVNERFDVKVIEALPGKGFTVRSTGGVTRVEKHGCAAELRKTPEGSYQMTLLPAVLVNGAFTRLWDAGYQKFLLTDDGKKYPALAAQLSSLRKFNEELRAALGIPTFYNEAIGSTCHLSVYDRVKGRPGAVPDDTVGARGSSSH